MPTRLQLILIGVCVSLCGAAGCVQAESAAHPYEYTNCAGVSSSLPLLGCEVMRVDLRRGEIVIRDNIEKIDVRKFEWTEKKSRFMALESSLLPIAIPKENYSRLNEWSFQGRRYIKSSGSRVLPFMGSKQFDAVIVLDDSKDIGSVDSKNPDSNPKLFEKSILTFLYSPVRGVVAIGFPNGSNGSGSGATEVTFCAAERCLFDEEFMKLH